MIHDYESATEAALQWRESLCEIILDLEHGLRARARETDAAMHPAVDRISRAAIAAMEGAVDALSREREAELHLQPPKPVETASWPFAFEVLPDPKATSSDQQLEIFGEPPEQLEIVFEPPDDTGCGCAGAPAVEEHAAPPDAPAVIGPAPELRTIVVNPGKLGFELSECERCFVRSVRDQAYRPGAVPEFFNVADEATKLAFEAAMTTDGVVDLGAPDVPRFAIVAHNLNVLSTPVPFPDLGVALQIKGRLDALVRLDDGREVIVDYKTAKRDVDLAKYHGQLGAYALAAAWPVDGVEPVDVASTALLVLKPDAVAIRPPKLAISGSLRWIEVERDDAAMVGRLRHAASLLVGAVAPEHNHKCPWCLFYGAVPAFAGSR